jgi:hypothetical protein
MIPQAEMHIYLLRF